MKHVVYKLFYKHLHCIIQHTDVHSYLFCTITSSKEIVHSHAAYTEAIRKYQINYSNHLMVSRQAGYKLILVM